MNCPHCGVPLMGGMKVCPKCKYDTRTSDGGPQFAARLKEQGIAAEERAELIKAKAIERVQKFTGEILGIPGVVYSIKGSRGRSIDIYPYKVVITTDVTLARYMTE